MADQEQTKVEVPGRDFSLIQKMGIANGVMQSAVDTVADIARRRCADLAGALFKPRAPKGEL